MWRITCKLTAPRTRWFNNDWKPGHTAGLREDKIISLSRVYSRTYRFYSWHLCIGRLMVRIWNFPAKKDVQNR